MPSRRLKRRRSVIVLSKKKRRRRNPGSLRVSLSGLRTRVHTFKRCVYVHDRGLQTDASGNFFLGRAFRISDLNNVAEFTSLFDRFRILKVVYCLVMEHTATSDPAKDQTQFPNTSRPREMLDIVAVKDPDDAITPVNTGQFTERGVIPRPWPRNRKWSFTLSPIRNSEVDIGGTASIPRARWSDMSLPTQDHFGMKLWMVGTPTTTYKFREMVTYYFQCEGIR